MKKATLVSLVILMALSFSVPSYAGFRVHPAQSHMLFSAIPADNDTKDAKPAKKETGVFGIVSIAAGVVACLMPAAGAIIAILLGAGAIVFGAMGMSKKKKLHGLAIAGLVLGIIAIIGGIILL